ncbi:hypothetical protein Ancab_031679 [Ancistrocladus abbreviatus]
MTMIGIEFFLSEINGRDITELIAAGREKLASVLTSGGGASIAVAAAANGAGSSGSVFLLQLNLRKRKKWKRKESDEICASVSLTNECGVESTASSNQPHLLGFKSFLLM